MNIRYQLCDIHDLPQLIDVSKNTFTLAFADVNTKEDMNAYVTKAFNSEQMKSELTNKHSEFYFAKVDDKIAGYLKLNVSDAQSDLKEDVGLEVERIYVLQDFQGKGIGKKLIDFAIELAKTRNKKYVWLGVWDQNSGAIRFYERQGFIKFGSHSFMLGNDLQTDNLMKLEL